MNKPCVPLGLQPSFGFGDRTGLATPGHVAAMFASGQGIAPIFAQQSIREMTRTARTPGQVMHDAVNGAQHSGWQQPMGADADHLKTSADIQATWEAGFTFFTLDPSDDVDPRADQYSEGELATAYSALPAELAWEARYAGRKVGLVGGSELSFSSLACRRAAVKYARGVARAVRLAKELESLSARDGRPYEIELSVDETPHPTLPVEHFIVAEQCLQAGMRLVSLAPRFVGEFEKGIDFKGDLAAFTASLQTHAAIAQTLGPYKLSLHSGSDKLSIYGLLAQATRGQFHVKTAGTSYLEALRVIAQHDPRLFAAIVDFARQVYPRDRATYHVSAELSDAPTTAGQTPAQLEASYLERWSDVPSGKGFTQLGRQILHCTFGSVLTHPEFGPALHDSLKRWSDSYQAVLQEHFSRHLQALQGPAN